MKINKKWIFVFLAPTVILFFLIYALPLIMTFFTSLFDYRLAPKRFEFVGFANYVKLLFEDEIFRQSLINTLVWILLQCTLHVFLGLMLALVLYKKPFGWKFVRTVYMIPNIISNAAMAMIFLNVFNPKFGVVNSFLKAIGLENLSRNWLFESDTAFTSISFIWMIFAGYTTILILSEALTIDTSVIEATKIDGASNFQTDMFIVIPLLRKMIGTTVILGASYMLQMFDLIYITTKGGPGTATMNLPLMLYRITTSENNYGYANTIGVIIILLGFISLTVINKLFKMHESDY